MSCDNNRKHFFRYVAEQFPQIDAAKLERTFQTVKSTPANQSWAFRSMAQARTKALFEKIASVGLKPPTHQKTGLPRGEQSIAAYAAVYELLENAGVFNQISGQVQVESLKTKPWVGSEDSPVPMDEWVKLCDEFGRYKGLDRWGFDANGIHFVTGRARGGYDENGFDVNGYNRFGFSKFGLDADGYNVTGLKDGLNRKGLNEYGFTGSPEYVGELAGVDDEGYDIDGIGPDGYDRAGLDRRGRDRNGVDHFAPDENGIYPDGLPENPSGWMPDGLDMWGYDQEGFFSPNYSTDVVSEYLLRDKDGFGRDGLRNGVDRNGISISGWDFGSNGRKHDTFADAQNGWNPEGRNQLGEDRNGFLPTGFNADGKDIHGKPRRVFVRGVEVQPKYERDGFAQDGLDRWGYGRDGLTPPDANGHQYNVLGWRYNPDKKCCESTQTPGLSVPHYGYQRYTHAPNKRIRRPYVEYSIAGISHPVTPPLDPNARPKQLENQESAVRFLQFKTVEARWLCSERRAQLNPKATYQGRLLRCPRCGQFTGAKPHTCPQTFQRYPSIFFPGGAVKSVNGRDVMVVPNGDYANYPYPNFNTRLTVEASKIIRYGLDSAGYDKDGYGQDGYDRNGYDRDGYDRNGFNREGVNRWGTRFVPKLDAVKPAAVADGIDLLNNNDLAALYSRVATGLVGKPRQVILREGDGFSTDMKGKIYADPYPLGRKAKPAENALVTRAGIYHELGHELFTRPDIWAQVLEIADGRQDVGLSEQARKLLPMVYNIVEDGRMERVVSTTYPGVREMLAASCRLSPRWSETVGEGAPIEHELQGALLYTGLPFFSVSDDVRENMSPKGRAIFEELEPLVMRAVRNKDPEDAFDAAVVIAERLASLAPVDAKQFTQPKPPANTDKTAARTQPPQRKKQDDQQGAGRQRGQGQDEDDQQDAGNQRGQSQDEDDQQGAGRQRGQGQDEDDQQGAGRQRGQGQGEDEQQGDDDGFDNSQSGTNSQRGQGAGSSSQKQSHSPYEPESLDDDDWELSDDELDNILSRVERESAIAISAGVQRRAKPSSLGKRLQSAIKEDSQEVRAYWDGTKVSTASVKRGSVQKRFFDNYLQSRRSRHREVATRLAAQLRAIRQQTEQRLKRQQEGKLDRRQMVNAVKGANDVYQRTRALPQTSMAVSIAIDMSGSMYKHVGSHALYDAGMVLCDTLQSLEMPHEVMAFGDDTVQIKAMSEDQVRPESGAFLAYDTLGGTNMAGAAGLATSCLISREEHNKLFISLTDGALSDFESVRATFDYARKQGVLPFGIYLGENPPTTQMDALYGRGGWTNITSLDEFPKKVGQRLAIVFNSLKPVS